MFCKLKPLYIPMIDDLDFFITLHKHIRKVVPTNFNTFPCVNIAIF